MGVNITKKNRDEEEISKNFLSWLDYSQYCIILCAMIRILYIISHTNQLTFSSLCLPSLPTFSWWGKWWSCHTPCWLCGAGLFPAGLTPQYGAFFWQSPTSCHLVCLGDETSELDQGDILHWGVQASQDIKETIPSLLQQVPDNFYLIFPENIRSDTWNKSFQVSKLPSR